MRRAFSLVELSIVLVVLGLLTGGILTGQSLIRAAELRSVSADLSRYQAAVLAFRDRYMELPGDMPNATSFWGAADNGDGEGSDCFTVDTTTLSDPKKTCNGGGDGAIDYPKNAAGIWTNGERFHAWNQLANAGLVEGSYTGKTDSTSNDFYLTAGKNMPASKMSNGLYDLNSMSPSPAGGASGHYLGNASNVNPGLGGHYITFRPSTGATPPLTPEEAWNVDAKIDDGSPGLGSVQSYKKTSEYPDCVTSDFIATAAYDFSQTDKKCALLFRMF